jgi:DNA-binding transcriptional ArsR family regulator
MFSMLALDRTQHFAYHQIMNVNFADTQLAQLAGAIAEPARARILCCLMDGHARTSTELSVVAEVSPSTTSVHLAKLKQQNLVKLVVQGKHRYYQLAGPEVATALEALLQLAGVPRQNFVPNTPTRLRKARTCYDHMAGEVAVAIHDNMMEKNWLQTDTADATTYYLSAAGVSALEQLGIDLNTACKTRRRFACACIDWSERKPHLAGALGAALLSLLLTRRWVERDLDSRALNVTREGKTAFRRFFNVDT